MVTNLMQEEAVIFTDHNSIVVGGHPAPRDLDVMGQIASEQVRFIDMLIIGQSLSVPAAPEPKGVRVSIEEAHQLLKNPMLTAWHEETPVARISRIAGGAWLLHLAPGYGNPREVFADDSVRLEIVHNGKLQPGQMRLDQAFARARLNVLSRKGRSS